MGVSFPGGSAEYRVARDRLLGQEAELRRVTEAVAAARRELPPRDWALVSANQPPNPIPPLR